MVRPFADPVQYLITLGPGKRLFGEVTIPAAFRVTESQVTSAGVVLVSYERAGAIRRTVGWDVHWAPEAFRDRAVVACAEHFFGPRHGVIDECRAGQQELMQNVTKGVTLCVRLRM